jgi:arylsulfatase A-like enzyme
MIRTILLAFTAIVFLSFGAIAGADRDGSQPNTVLIIGDDCGWTDYGFMGHPVVQTPSLDRLARESMVFKSGYVSAPLCCPSLASILTGLHPHQSGVLGNEPPPPRGDRTRFYELVDQVPSLPRLLGEHGYLSFQTGKWWHGNYAHGGFTHGMTLKGRHGDAGLAIGRETMQPIFEFISTAQQQKQPFLVWYAPIMPHTPHTPPARLLEKYEALEKENAAYFGMIEWFDETCGQLLDHLDQQGLSDNTIVIYLADNGWKQGAASPLHDGKRSPYEGGTRTPILIRWPGHIRPGVSVEPVMSIDLAPTILRAAGLKPTDRMQGLNLLDLLDGSVRRDCIFGAAYHHDMQDWDNPQQSLQARWVIENGQWKLLSGQGPVELYDLSLDPHEQNNLADENPAVIQRLSAQLDQWWAR